MSVLSCSYCINSVRKTGFRLADKCQTVYVFLCKIGESFLAFHKICMICQAVKKYFFPPPTVLKFNVQLICVIILYDGVLLLFYLCLNSHYTPAQRSWRGGILDSPCPSVCPSVRPSVCRRHGFRSISQVSFGISISNFICMLMVAIGRSLLIFSDITFKMAAWRPYWIFWFPDSNFTLALNINFKLKRHNTYVYG